MADKRISQLVDRGTIENNDVVPIVVFGASTTNKATISSIQTFMQENLDVGVTSVGLTMPSAFVVSNSPVTTSGNISVTGAGTVSQYIRGDGSLADFPQGGGGGGSSVNYYLNGSVSQGTIGGIAYVEMNKTPILGTGTDFTINADGYIASFITDAGDPALLEIPSGNWNFETYFQASSGGGTPSFYIELYKVNSGGTATLIASNSATPELIAFGTTTTPYFSALAVPTTSLTLTDRLALRYYVTHSGRTITLHTENATLCQIITTFTTGLTALNGLTAQVQNFTTGTSGTNFGISSTGSTHTFNLPDASATARGVVTTGSQVFGGVKTFTNGASFVSAGGTNQVTRFVNIGSIHEGSASTNQIGFNNSNNIYFGKGLNNGGVIQWTNAAVRYYTLPDADGTIALTSDLGNYIQGVGTTDSIPKFTGARTIANSAIRDTTSTVVISKNVSVDNGASQAINLTPASGGTTNRIETTGTLPLSLVTSGSSITLAAGGVTPQITLASTGAVTLTGALNGTTASFTGNVTSTGGNFRLFNGYYITAKRADGVDINVLGFPAGSNNLTSVTPNDYNLQNTGGQNLFSVASTGAATFSSSVTAGAAINLPNNFSLTGRNAANTLNISLISRNTSDRVVIDADGYGTNIGGGGTVLINPTGGNVGIGTASPSGKLTISSDQSLNNQFLNIVGTQSGFNQQYFIGIATSSKDLRFYDLTANSERMRITSGGFLKASNTGSYIGVTQTYHELRSDRSNENIAIFQNTSSSPYGPRIDFSLASPNDTTRYFILCSDSTTNRFVVYSNGNVVNTNGSYGAISDAKLKENIEDATPKLDDLMKVKVRNYNLIGDDKKQIGVIAQELEEVFPAMIDESEDFEEVEVPKVDEEGNEVLNEEGEVVTENKRVSKGTTTKSVKYSVFVPMLIKAIQELKTEIDSLKNQMQ